MLPVLLLLILLWWCFPLTAPSITPVNISLSPNTTAFFERRSLPPPPTRSVHSISVAAIEDELQAFWYGGSHEGARDVNLYQAIFRDQNWSHAKILLQRTDLQQQLHRNIRRIGNPVAFYHPQNERLWLFFVSVSYGGWAGSAINAMFSDNHGQNWSPPQRLIVSPFLNLSTLVKGAPLPLEDGSILLPVYHEFIHSLGEILVLDAEGHITAKWRLSHYPAALQPVLLAHPQQGLYAWLRNGADDPAHCCQIWETTSADGVNWNPLQTSGLVNPNAAIAVFNLGAYWLMAFNDHLENRSEMSLAWRTAAPDSTWRKLISLENEPHERFAYPWMVADHNGYIHLFYTHSRRRFLQVIFTPAWLQRQDANL